MVVVNLFRFLLLDCFSIAGVINVQGQIGDVPHVLFKNVAQMPTRVSLTLLQTGSTGDKVLRFIVSQWPWPISVLILTCPLVTCAIASCIYWNCYLYIFELFLPVLFLPINVLILTCAVVACTCLNSYTCLKLLSVHIWIFLTGAFVTCSLVPLRLPVDTCSMVPLRLPIVTCSLVPVRLPVLWYLWDYLLLPVLWYPWD